MNIKWMKSIVTSKQSYTWYLFVHHSPFSLLTYPECLQWDQPCTTKGELEKEINSFLTTKSDGFKSVSPALIFLLSFRLIYPCVYQTCLSSFPMSNTNSTCSKPKSSFFSKPVPPLCFTYWLIHPITQGKNLSFTCIC